MASSSLGPSKIRLRVRMKGWIIRVTFPLLSAIANPSNSPPIQRLPSLAQRAHKNLGMEYYLAYIIAAGLNISQLSSSKATLAQEQTASLSPSQSHSTVLINPNPSPRQDTSFLIFLARTSQRLTSTSFAFSETRQISCPFGCSLRKVTLPVQVRASDYAATVSGGWWPCAMCELSSGTPIYPLSILSMLLLSQAESVTHFYRICCQRAAIWWVWMGQPVAMMERKVNCFSSSVGHDFATSSIAPSYSFWLIICSTASSIRSWLASSLRDAGRGNFQMICSTSAYLRC